MVSHSYPNVNRHIFASIPARNVFTLTHSYHDEATLKVTSQPSSTDPEGIAGVEGQRRISAPPPYSEDDPVAQAGTFTSKALTKKQPSLLLEVAIGHRMASHLTQKRENRRLARLEKVHGAWMRLGVDTRQIMSQGGRLPPYFMNPPQCGPQEMNDQMTQMGF
ncbi:hypothetical protein CBS101457_000705 [Exobasidium rhododendri]|nr:hypothetical protein CBS101457_000705 [Exobasidium rhododendri]